MSQLDKLETTLDDALNKKAPFKLPAEARKTLGDALWWIVLIFGLLQLWAAWDLWRLGYELEKLPDYTYAGVVLGNDVGFLFYLSLFVLMVTSVMLLLATPGLKAMRKAGWNLVFYALLFNVMFGLLRLFSGANGGIDDLLWALFSSLVGAYLLFQVRERFSGAKLANHTTTKDKK
jgi:hypothetical protein